MAIRATDNEELATELWGQDKYWDEQRLQFLPKEKGGVPSAGNKSVTSSSPTRTADDKTKQVPQTTVPTTGRPSSKDQKGSSDAPSTVGSGTVKQSPGKDKQ